MRGSPGTIRAKGLEASGQGELVPTGPPPPLSTPLPATNTHTNTHIHASQVGSGGLRYVGETGQ